MSKFNPPRKLKKKMKKENKATWIEHPVCKPFIKMATYKDFTDVRDGIKPLSEAT